MEENTKETTSTMKWYVIRTVAGKEKKTKERLEFEIRTRGYSGKMNQLLIPLERVFHMRNGKKVATERNYYPGYLVIECEPGLLGEIQHMKKSVDNLVGFLGDDKPTPLRKQEVERILGKMDELSMKDEQPIEKFFVGETVKIMDGPFNSFVGNIEEVSEDRRKVKVNVKIFGRKTPIELDYGQIQKDV